MLPTCLLSLLHPKLARMSRLTIYLSQTFSSTNHEHSYGGGTWWISFTFSPSLPPSLSFSLCSLSLSHPHTLSLSTLYLSMYTMGNLAKQLKHTESEAAHTCKLSFSHTHAHTHAHTLAHSHTHTRMCVYAYTYTYLQISRVYT